MIKNNNYLLARLLLIIRVVSKSIILQSKAFSYTYSAWYPNMNHSIAVLLVMTLATKSCRSFAPIKTTLQQPSPSPSFQDRNNQINRHGQKLLMIGNFFNFDKNKKDDEDIAISNKEEANDSTKSSEYVESDDPVEKLFSFFFGEKEEKPMGLARFGANRFPGMFYIPHLILLI